MAFALGTRYIFYLSGVIYYLLRRILFFVPTLLIVAAAAFLLSKMASGDPVEEFFETSYTIRDYERVAKQLKLDKPVFYFSITTSAFPDTLHKILPLYRRSAQKKLCGKSGNWEAVEDYFARIEIFNAKIDALPDTLNKSVITPLAQSSKALFYQHNPDEIGQQLDEMSQAIEKEKLLNDLIGGDFKKLKISFATLNSPDNSNKMYIPKWNWYGSDNQFHHWFFSFLKGDFGTSYTDGRPVASRLYDHLFWTFIMNLIAILLAFAIAVPLGVQAAVRRGSKFDRITSLLLFGLYSLPVFWIGTLLVVFFTTPEYGMNFFPSIGLGDIHAAGSSVLSKFWLRAGHLILPVSCLTYPALAMIARQMRSAVLQELGKDYIRTARAKGLSEKQVVWKHAFRNSLFPVITLIGGILPATIAGSVVIEYIFNIPGMGKLMIEAIFQRDWPVVYAVMMMGAILTMSGILLADVLYAWADPRVRISKK